MANSMENIEATVAEMRKALVPTAIKDVKFQKLVNFTDQSEVGVEIFFTLAPNFLFYKWILEKWQQDLKAFDYHVTLKEGKLLLSYYVQFPLERKKCKT